MASVRDVISFEVTRTIQKRSFWIASITPVLIILAVFGIEYASNHLASKNSQQQAQALSQTAKIAVLDESGLINTQALASEHITLEPTQSAGIAAVKNGRVDAFFYYPSNVSKSGIDVYAQDQGISLTPPYNTIATQLLNQNVIAKLDSETKNIQAVRVLQNSPTVTTTTYKNGQQTNSTASIIAPGLFLVAFLVVMILLSYIMVSSVSEEKENRVAEILLTAIKAQTLIMGKIISIFVIALIQILTIVVPLLIAYPFLKNHISLPGGVSLAQIPLNAEAILFGALFLMSGLVMYTGIMVGMGAMFPNARDASRFVGLAMIWVYVPIYTISLIITSPQDLIVKVFTYFPLTAPTTAMLRNTLGSLSTPAALGSLAIVIASAVLAMLFAVRAFRYGAMEYGRRMSLKDLLQ